MDSFQREFIKVLKSSVTGEKITLSKDFDIAKASQLIKKHAIPVLAYYGLLNSDIDQNDEFMQELMTDTCHYVVANGHQTHCIDVLFKAFDDNGIDYMPLKGVLYKKYYPKPEQRYMADTDVLIKTEQYESIEKIVDKLGYKFNIESDHEYIWHKKPYMHLELHKRLIPSYNKDYYAYFGDGWKLATIKNGTRYSMTDSDQMIYLITHFAKHYRDSGIGIRHLLDLWVFRENAENLDENYIKSKLDKLRLSEFYKNILDTIDVWFGNGESTPVTDAITDNVFDSGSYGTAEASLLSVRIKESEEAGSIKKAKIIAVFKMIFPSYSDMCARFPVLVKAKVLLPVFWIVRIVKGALFKRKSVKQQVSSLSTDKINTYRQKLNFVGLDYNFDDIKDKT